MTSVQIKEKRIRAGLTQSQLGMVLGLAQVSIAKWETGKWAPELKHRIMLRIAFGDSRTAILNEMDASIKAQTKEIEARLKEARANTKDGPRGGAKSLTKPPKKAKKAPKKAKKPVRAAAKVAAQVAAKV